MAAIAIFAFVSGAVAGSFVSVVAHRVPRGESIVSSRSRCPHCRGTIAAFDNVPVLSWFVLRGHCRRCGARISPRYLLVEPALGAGFVATAVVFREQPAELGIGFVFVTLLAAVTLTDLERRVIPNRIVLAGALIGVVLIWAVDASSLAERALAAAAAGSLLLIAAVAYPRGMGMGDVKLASVMGLYLGRAVAPALLIGFGTGALIGVALIFRRGPAARKQAIPFAPFLALGGFAGLLVGGAPVDVYLDRFTGA